MLAHIEPIALAAQQVFRRDHQVLDLDLGMSAAQDVRQRPFRRHGLDVANDPIAGIG